MTKSAYIRRYYSKRQLVEFIILCLLLGCIPSLQIMVESCLIDSAILGIESNALSQFVRYLSIYLLLLVCSSFGESLLQRNSELHSLAVGKKFDTERLEKSQKVSFQTMETQEFHELFEKAGKAPELDSSFYNALKDELTGFVKIITSLIVLLRIDVWTSILVVLLLLGIAINAGTAKNSNGFWENYIRNMRRTNYLSSLLLHREYAVERKIFNYSDEIGRRYKEEFSLAVKQNAKLGRKRFSVELITTGFSAFYSVAAILLLLRPLSGGAISIGTFIAAFSAVGKLKSVSSQVYASIFTKDSSFSQMSGFFSFLLLDEEHECPTKGAICLPAEIEFRSVSYSYPNAEAPVLEDVSFTLHPGMHYAIVGENGCGKTTLVKLLLGLYQPTAGSIFVGGKDLQSMSRKEKQGLFSVMFQDFYRYPISVRENISLSSSEEIETDRMRSILSALGIKAPFLMEEDGLDRSLRLLKEGGIDLSGGEWQKVVAARCVLASAPIAVLDEPNAALDPVSEEVLFHVYKEMLDKKTTLFISHRLGVVKSADKILVLHNKRLSAMGSHEKLMQTCVYYRDLFETQRRLYYET